MFGFCGLGVLACGVLGNQGFRGLGLFFLVVLLVLGFGRSMALGFLVFGL